MHRRLAQARMLAAVAALVVLALLRPAQPLLGQQAPTDSDRAAQFDAVRQKALQQAQVRVIVSLRLDVDHLTAAWPHPAACSSGVTRSRRRRGL